MYIHMALSTLIYNRVAKIVQFITAKNASGCNFFFHYFKDLGKQVYYKENVPPTEKKIYVSRNIATTFRSS